ncbi:MAG: 5'-nucleotidase [Bacteroidales bacterium]
MSVLQPSPSFEREFAADRAKVEDYLDDTITWLAEEMRSLDALFGPSSMMSLIHQLQKEISGADLSFTAPLSLNSTLRKGPLLVSDMFALYRFENLLYTMDLSGREIDGFLEYAAGLWFQGTGGQEPHLLRFDPDHPGRLAEPYYNFSTASGIDYEIDLRKPVGDRVAIQRFSNGNPFDPDSTYRVAVNSYRGNGGGGHLTQGSGIPQGELAGRVVGSTDIDLRYLLMQMLSQHDTLRPRAESNWKILPEDWARSASASDRLLLE